jgi:hypothetical protein
MPKLQMQVEIERLPLKSPFRISGYTFTEIPVAVVTLRSGALVTSRTRPIELLPPWRNIAPRSRAALIDNNCWSCCHGVARGMRSTVRCGTCWRSRLASQYGNSRAWIMYRPE